MIGDIWDAICDGVAYVFSFEWLGDIAEFFSSLFENIGEFSIIGLAFGLVGVITIYLARDYMLYPFLIHMDPTMAIFWGVATYIGTFIAGYLVGKRMGDT